MAPARSTRSHARRGRDERGVVLVEFAFALFPLLLIALGMIDFGRALHAKMQQTDLSNVAARWAVVNYWPACPPETDLPCSLPLQDYIEDEGDKVTPGTKACIRFENGIGNPGSAVTVRLTAPFKWFGLFTGFGEIESKATMRLEVNPTRYQPDPPESTDCPEEAT